MRILPDLLCRCCCRWSAVVVCGLSIAEGQSNPVGLAGHYCNGGRACAGGAVENRPQLLPGDVSRLAQAGKWREQLKSQNEQGGQNRPPYFWRLI